ncbi:hypothetical protein Ancab_002033 [Ancistrocladus abbreviatus]
MPKKPSSKVSRTAKEGTAAEQVKSASKKTPKEEQEKPSATPNKIYDEIDAIFSSKKRKNPGKQQVERTDDNADGKPEKMLKKKGGKGSRGSGLSDTPSGSRRKTQDGLAIYTEEDLGINRKDAGNTPLCPFDCSCCF